MEIRKVEDTHLENKTDNFTKTFRNLVAERIGQLDAAHSFMYLFNRFGIPNETTKDDYKIVYAYNFSCGDCIISIHASYRNHVYFNFFAPKKIWDDYEIFFSQKIAHIQKRLNNAGIPFVDYWGDFYFNQTKAARKNIKIIKAFLTKEEKYSMYVLDDESISEKKRDEITKRLIAITRKHLTEEELNFVNPKVFLSLESPRLDLFPEIKNAAHFFIDEMLKPISVRDVQYNIKEYWSK